MSLTNPTIGLFHTAYQLQGEYLARGGKAKTYGGTSLDALYEHADEIDVLVMSGLWRNDLLPKLPRLRYIQASSSGTDQFDKAALKAAGVRLASGQGINERAVAEHAISLILSFTRQLHQARDRQKEHAWRGVIADYDTREQELGGKTLIIVGLGRIGLRLAALANAFGMRVIGVKRNPEPQPNIEAIIKPDQLLDVVGEADFLALTCPLTPETEGLIGARVLAALKPSAILINVARGRVVDEPAMIEALSERRFAGAGLDCFYEEPLPASSPLWDMPHVLITPHTAGETRVYERNVMAILDENLARLARGETTLLNQIV